VSGSLDPWSSLTAGRLEPNRCRTIFGPGVMAARQTLALNYEDWRMMVGSSHRPMDWQMLGSGPPGQGWRTPPPFTVGASRICTSISPLPSFACFGTYHSRFSRRRGSRLYYPGWAMVVTDKWIASSLECRELASVAISRSVQRIQLYCSSPAHRLDGSQSKRLKYWPGGPKRKRNTSETGWS